MALDLFLNFERQSNNSLFYRSVSSADYTVAIKLSDQELSNFVALATASYVAEYSINNSATTSYDFLTGAVTVFERTTPCISSVQVFLSSMGGTFLGKYELSASFLDQFPVADFIVYPNSYFDEVSCTLNYLSASNYFESPGVYFYGEGHTEIINLSTSSTTEQISGMWVVGTEENSYQVNQIDLTTAVVSISTYSGQNELVPVSLKLYTESIQKDGPSIFYDEETGVAQNYSFFLTTTSLLTTTNLKDSIAVRPYSLIPDPRFEYVSPFSLNRFNLPFDYSNQTFVAKLQQLSAVSILTERLDKSTWELEANSRAGDWMWSKQLEQIYTYYFPLGYDNSLNEVPAFLKCSPTENTTITQRVTASRVVQIDFPPYDWLGSTQTETFSSQTSIIPIPYIKLYLPDYLHLRNEDVLIRSVELYTTDDFVLKQLTVIPEDGTTVTLSGSQLLNPFAVSFQKLGTKNLSAYCTFYNQSVQQNQTIVNVFPDMVKIVDQYDTIDLDSYHSKSSPFVLSLSAAPLVSPNEWAVEDNINSVTEKFYSAIEEIESFTQIYNTTTKFYGWLGNPVYAWSDLECPPNQETEVAWKQHEICTGPNITAGHPIFWLDHECEEQIGDPSCLQKYCLEWKWKTRKRSTSDILTTWKETKCANQYAKKWRFEVCEADNELLNCDKGKWYIQTIDQDYFPPPFCIEKTRCAIKGILQLSDDKIVVAHDTELNLLDNTYQSTLMARRGIADEIFPFINITAIALTKNERLYVLDSTIPRVCIYEIKNNSFVYYDSWGRFGRKSSLYGFNKPKDLHVNQLNEILVCDSGNKCIKRYTSVGKHIQTIDTEAFESTEPLSVCQDSEKNFHILFDKKIVIVSFNGKYINQYELPSDVVNPTKLNSSYNRELIYVAHENGIVKHFKDGTFFEHVLNKFECADNTILTNFTSIYQDEHRNLLITAQDKILKVMDHMELVYTRTPILSGLYWQKSDVLIHKEEYIQPWVYLKSFHRLWDNIELLRNSLFYETSGCKTYSPPVYSKDQITIGQNEIVTNAVINRLSEQLWSNLTTLTKYFKCN